MSGIGYTTKAMRQARGVAKVAIVEATSVRIHGKPPKDWAQLYNALLKRFRSHIRSQEAQSMLMSISQGQRPVREYASQFETLLGRLDIYDENMMFNQFIRGL